MFAMYLGSLWPSEGPEMVMVNEMGCEAIPMLPKLGLPAGIFNLCDEPTVASTCAATCNTNCWYV